MVLQTLQQVATDDRRPPVREYGVLFVAVLVSLLLQALVGWGVDAAAEWLPRVLDPQLVGAVVYASLGTVALATMYGVARHLERAPRLGREDRVSLVGVATLILFVAAYRLHGSATVPVVPDGIVTALLSGGVLALVAGSYARLQEVDLRLEAPDRESFPLAGGMALTAGLAGVGWVLAAATWAGTPLVITVGDATAPAFPVDALVRVVLGGVLVGGGTALLYNGAIQEGLRDRLGPAGAVAAVTALAAGSFVDLRPFRQTDAVSVVAGTAVVVLLALLAGAVAAWTVRTLPRVVDLEPTPLVAAAVGAIAVVLPLAVLVPMRAAAWRLALAMAMPVVAATATVGYERSRSVWVPALAFIAYFSIGDWAVVTYVARLLG